jgi:endogenous inhibitor of DNA gyrase (YacG/DUF329 family)
VARAGAVISGRGSGEGLPGQEYNRFMAETEKTAVICPSCGKPTRTGFAADIETLRTNLGQRNKPNDYKTKCQNCGAWIFWSKAELVPERLLNQRPQDPK